MQEKGGYSTMNIFIWSREADHQSCIRKMWPQTVRKSAYKVQNSVVLGGFRQFGKWHEIAEGRISQGIAGVSGGKTDLPPDNS
ncbi:hypothetical protein D0S45_19215 [Marinifilum sp. JC120]|nr:hypothetical protein D0S45_19215 [Marinifilum sp. JC120]